MKLKLSLRQLAHPIFTSAFKLLREKRWLPKDSYWLSKAGAQLEEELSHYHSARGDAIIALGIRIGEDWAIPASDLAAIQQFNERMAPLNAREITLTLNAKLKWPLDDMISPDEQELLERYGFLETLSIPEPEDKTEASPAPPTVEPTSETESPPRNGGLPKNRLRKSRLPSL